MPTKRTNKRIHSCPILTFSWHSFCDLLRSFAFPSHCLHVGCYDCNDSCVLTTTLVFSWSDEMCCVKKWTLRPWVLCLHHGNGSGAPKKREKMYANDICESFVKHVWNLCDMSMEYVYGIIFLSNHVMYILQYLIDEPHGDVSNLLFIFFGTLSACTGWVWHSTSGPLCTQREIDISIRRTCHKPHTIHTWQ